ncbi:MAG: alginate O-acetyltransferase complex protein AlgI, partial [Hyphomicrobiales bacterium]|nr:alginate O-acetyltransferase complex protein AlgI [Hyphomicrobiales bacterium]
FVVWGAHHGAFLILERAGWAAPLLRHAWLARLYALLAVMTGWVWFRAHDLDHALSFFGALAGRGGVTDVSSATRLVAHPVTICALLIGVALATVRIDLRRLLRSAAARAAHVAFLLTDTAAIMLLFVLSILTVAAGSYSPFLYFRF